VLVEGKLTHRAQFDPGAVEAALAISRASNIERSGKGHFFATGGSERFEQQRETSFRASFDVTDFFAGWLGAWTFGKVLTSGVGPYTHVFTWERATNQAPVTSVYTEDGAGIKTKWPDLYISELQLSGQPVGPLQAQLTMLGSGRHTDVSMTLPALPTNVYLLGSATDILIGPQGAPVSIKERVRQWSVSFAGGIEPYRGSGGDVYASMTRLGQPRCSISLVVACKDTDDIRSLFIAGTLRELQINTSMGAAAQLNLKFPGVYITEAPFAMEGNMRVYQITIAEQDVIKSGSSEHVEFTAINSQVTYLAT